jgi:membrane-associated phospholipid phosphatase
VQHGATHTAVRGRWVTSEHRRAATLIGYALSFTLIAWYALVGPGARVDLAILHWSASHRPARAARCEHWLILLGSPVLMPSALLLCAVVVALRRKSLAPLRQAVTVLGLLIVAVLGAKNLIARPGPWLVTSPAGSVHPVAHGPDSPWAFPSGHATTALVTWTAGARLLLPDHRVARARPLPPLIGAVVSVALVAGGIHWLTDVLAAWPFAFLINEISAAVAGLHLSIARVPGAGRDPVIADAPAG